MFQVVGLEDDAPAGSSSSGGNQINTSASRSLTTPTNYAQLVEALQRPYGSTSSASAQPSASTASSLYGTNATGSAAQTEFALGGKRKYPSDVMATTQARGNDKLSKRAKRRMASGNAPHDTFENALLSHSGLAPALSATSSALAPRPIVDLPNGSQSSASSVVAVPAPAPTSTPAARASSGVTSKGKGKARASTGSIPTETASSTTVGAKGKARASTGGTSAKAEAAPERRKAAIRRVESGKIKDRVERVLSQRMFCISREKVHELKESFCVSGSTGNVSLEEKAAQLHAC